MKHAILTTLALVGWLALSGCATQPTRSTGFVPGGIQKKTLPAGVPQRVAVFIGGNPAIAGQAREQFSMGLLELGFDVVERNQLAALTNELHLAQTGLVTPETAVEAGRLVGADGVFVGNVSGESSPVWVDSHLAVRLVETASGKTIWAVNAHDPRAVTWSMAAETSIIHTTKAALKALQNDLVKMATPSR